MSRIVAIVLILLLALPALAQSPGTLNLVGPSSTPGAPQITRVDQLNAPINAALAAKADAGNGVLTNPTINGGAVNAATGAFSGALSAASGTFSGTLSAAGTVSGPGFTALVAPYVPLSGGTLTGPLIGTSGAFSGTLSAAGTVSGPGFTALLSPYALASSDALKLPLAGGTLTGPLIGTTGAFTTLNTTGLYQQNGATVLNQTNANQGSLTIGLGAGAALPGGSIFSTFIGWHAGFAFTGATGEATCIGTIACLSLVDGSFATALGENAMGQEVHAVASTAIGNDSQRSYVSATGGNTSVGKNSMAFGGGVNNTAVGTQALRGNAASALFTGSATAGDVITLTFTGPFVGSPQIASITVTPGQTTSQMATAMVAAIAAIPAIQTVALNGNLVNAFANLLQFGNYGTATTGSSVVITAGVTGSATEAVTIGGGAIGNNNAAFGYLAMQGLAMTTATENAGFGTNSLSALTSGTSNVGLGSSAGVSITSGINNVLAGRLAGSSLTTTNATTAIGFQALLNQTVGGNVAVGSSAGQSVTTGANQVLVGNNAGLNLTSGTANTAVGDGALTGAAASTATLNVAVGNGALGLVSSAQQDTAIGRNACNKVTTGGTNTCIGHNVGSTTLQTGSGNILIGNTTAVDTLAAGTSNEINIGGLLFYTTQSLSVPAVTACGTSPTIDAHANNRSGTITIGTATPASCTVTLAGTGYATWNHCRVTPGSALAAFAYSYTKTVLTITGTALSGNVEYDCDGV